MATICWQQDGISDNLKVYLGTSSNDMTFSSPATYTHVYGTRYRYCASFDNLKEETTYYYRIEGIDDTYSFKTLPSGDTFTFAVLGDSRTGINAHRAVVNIMKQYNFSFYFNTGDMVMDNYLSQWDIFFEIEAPILASHFFNPVEGNHDVGDDNILFSQLFYFPPGVTSTGSFYSFWVKNNFFLVVSTEKPFEPGTYQYNWIENQLKEANEKGAVHKFMFFHRPPFTSGFHGIEGIEEDYGVVEAREYLAPLAITYGVTVVFNGHDHCYERSYKDGVYFITTGGGGATPSFVKAQDNPYSQFFEPNADLEHFHFTLVEVGPTYVDIKAITIANEVMDHLVIGEKPEVKKETGSSSSSGWGCSMADGGTPLELLVVLMLMAIPLILMRRNRS